MARRFCMPAAPMGGTGVGPLLLAAFAAVLGSACTGDEEDVEASTDALGNLRSTLPGSTAAR